MKKNSTEIVFIIDKSGSMFPMVSDTIGGFNGMIEKQRKGEGEALVTTYLFNDSFDRIHDRKPIERVSLMSEKEYSPCGSTALLDCMGTAIGHIREVHHYIRKDDVPEHTIFVIITDGMENSSHKYSGRDIKKMVETQKKKGWEFIFLGANMDAFSVASNYGFSRNDVATYQADEAGTQANFDVIEGRLGSFRAGRKMVEPLQASINKARENRK